MNKRSTSEYQWFLKYNLRVNAAFKTYETMMQSLSVLKAPSTKTTLDAAGGSQCRS
ncbi:MAG: hypothetical protein KA508_05150 [Gammaproteobacteria bacterium]|nr:hypothetical protein [Gammaproteobacteria bacterium]